MRKLLNTLYVSSQGSYLRKEGETIVVEREQAKVLQLPVHTIGSVVCFGNVLVSPFLLGFCAENDVSVSFLTEHGRFLASVRGPVSGNVLLAPTAVSPGRRRGGDARHRRERREREARQLSNRDEQDYP